MLDPSELPTLQPNATADEHEASPNAATGAETFGRLLQRGIKRRTMLKGTGATVATLVVTPVLLNPTNGLAAPGKSELPAGGGRRGMGRDPGRRLRFTTVPPGNEPDIVVPPNYRHYVILKWGDPLFPDVQPLDINYQTGATQAQQFGFNCDLVLWFPLPDFIRRSVRRSGSPGYLADLVLDYLLPDLAHRYSRRALVAVNHEYTSGDDMFPSYDGDNPSQHQVEAEIEAHGMTIAEIVHRGGQWQLDLHSPCNRRLTGTSEMEISGPLRGHALMKTSTDPFGEVVRGTFNNCAGGKTPWGTVLSCEENFDQYFANYQLLAEDDPSKATSKRIPPEDGASDRKWEHYDPRFDVSQEPNEYNRFGYVVEIDPYDPFSRPLKRTALGRFKHEGAVPSIGRDGAVAIYSGDDARFEYVYKFICKGRYRKGNRRNNLRLLEDGTLYVARLDVGAEAGDDMGHGEWLPLLWEPGNTLDQAYDDNGVKLFDSQADVLLKTRLAADVVGATPMDRPEDVDVHPHNKRVYIALTNNSDRESESQLDTYGGREQKYAIDLGPDEANPRPDNQHGHVIELIEQDDDPTALRFRWNIFIRCGRPGIEADAARFAEIEDPEAVGVSPISDPDNVVFDEVGNLWIATDGQYFSDEEGFGQNDGVFAVPTEGPHRGLLRQFLSSVPGAEVCGPEFSGDNRTFFCAIQHPRDGEAFDTPWPPGEPVAKPSLIGVREISGKKIGS